MRTKLKKSTDVHTHFRIEEVSTREEKRYFVQRRIPNPLVSSWPYWHQCYYHSSSFEGYESEEAARAFINDKFSQELVEDTKVSRIINV